MPRPITVVTATTRPKTTREFWSSWTEMAVRKDLLSVVTIVNGPEYRTKVEELPGHELGKSQVILREKDYLGTVPAFALATGRVAGGSIVACLHDDLQFLERAWDEQLRDILSDRRVGLAGFGGAYRVGVEGMYSRPFDPMTLARHDFISNMRDAEAHGARIHDPRQVAVLDGFSQCFTPEVSAYEYFSYLDQLGIIHHAYDVALGCMMKRANLETWYVPVSCHHAGGRTAVADPGYQEWAKTQCPAGDQGIWWHAHRSVYDEFGDCLPFGV